MPRTDWGWRVTADELDSWILDDSPEVLAVNKPAHLLCHPTKNGPWSSLSSAVRERFGLDPIHLVSRLDRETSGVVLIGKTRESASRMRVQGRRKPPSLADLELMVRKDYLAILVGEMNGAVVVDQPLARPENGEFRNRQQVAVNGQRAVTHFEPIDAANGYTLVRAWPKTGRMHQIRVHAAWLGFPVAGDKLYPDENLQLEFLKDGWTPRLAERLPIDRQALHAAAITVLGQTWRAPIPADLTAFSKQIGLTLPLSPSPQTPLASSSQTPGSPWDPQMHSGPRP